MNVLIIGERHSVFHSVKVATWFLFDNCVIRTSLHSEVLISLDQLKRENYTPNLVIFDIDSLGIAEVGLLKIYRRMSSGDYLDENCTTIFVGSYHSNMEISGIPLLRKPFTINQLRNFIAKLCPESYDLA